MKLKILKTEVAAQALLTISAVLFYLYIILFTAEHEIEIIYLGILFLIGVFNLLGFVLRLFVVRSQLNFVYLYSVLAFFSLSFAIYFFLSLDFEIDADLIMKYLFLVGLLFNIYYIGYGYYLVKNRPQKKPQIKP